MTSARAKEAPFISVMIGLNQYGQAVVSLSYREGNPIIGEAVTDAVMKMMAAVENICTDERIELNAIAVDMTTFGDEPMRSEPAKAPRRRKQRA